MILILYILLIFISPTLADNIGSKLKIEPFNKFIRDFKTTVDDIYTNLPTQNEVKDIYDKTLS
jgi:hypothetical protein